MHFWEVKCCLPWGQHERVYWDGMIIWNKRIAAPVWHYLVQDRILQSISNSVLIGCTSTSTHRRQPARSRDANNYKLTCLKLSRHWVKYPSYHNWQDCHKWKSTHWSQKNLVNDSVVHEHNQFPKIKPINIFLQTALSRYQHQFKLKCLCQKIHTFISSYWVTKNLNIFIQLSHSSRKCGGVKMWFQFLDAACYVGLQPVWACYWDLLLMVSW